MLTNVMRLAALAAGVSIFACAALAQETPAADPETQKLEKEKAQYELKTAVANAAKAASEAEAAAAMAKVNSLPETKFGKTEAGTSAGLAEAGALMADAMLLSADQIAQLVPANTTTVLVLSGTERPEFSTLRLHEVRRRSVSDAYDEAEKKFDAVGERVELALGDAPQPAGVGDMALDPITITAGLSLLAKVGGLFASDFTVTGADIEPDDAFLAAAVASRVAVNGRNVFVGSEWLGTSTFNDLTSDLTALDAKRVEANDWLAKISAFKAPYAEAAEKAKKPDHKKKYVAVVAVLDEMAAQITSAITAHQSLADWLVQSPANGAAPLADVAQQLALSRVLANQAVIVLVKVNNAAQGNMTEQSLWTFFGGANFSVGVSSAITAQVINPSTGALVASAQYSCDSGYTRLNKIHDREKQSAMQCVKRG